MKVFLDVDPQLAAACQSAGRSIAGLEWVSDAREGEMVIVDKVNSLLPERRTLYLGPLSELVDSDRRADEFGEQLSIGHRRRFEPSIQSLCESDRAGQLGEFGLLRMHRWMGGPVSAWSRREELLASLDVVLWLCGERPETIYAVSNQGEAVLQVHLDFPKNGMAIIDFAWALPAGEDYDSLHLIGDRGAAYSDDHRNVSLLYSGDHPRALRVENEEAGLATLLFQFVNSTDNSGKPLICLGETLVAKQVADAVVRSSKLGKLMRREGEEFVE